MADSTPCSPDLLQLSLTIQQAYSQLNLLLSQQQHQHQHQHDPQKSSEKPTDSNGNSNSSSNSNIGEDSAKLHSAICAERQARSCHYTSQPTFFKSTSSMIPRCTYQRHPTHQQSIYPPQLSTSMSSSLLASPATGCPHDPWHQKYHHPLYHYSHSQQAPPHTETIQQYQCYNSIACHCRKYHHYQHYPVTSINTIPGSIYTAAATPSETTSSSCCSIPPPQPPPPPKTLVSPVGSINESQSTANSPVPVPSIHRNDLFCSEVDHNRLYPSPPMEKLKTSTYPQETLSPKQDAHAINSDKKLKTDQPSIPRGWWKSKWHRFRTRNKTSVHSQFD
ncbi:hypothetical protein [Absidia glauca]|uniref:Uncharacterized protein n=1 Tax=Absidia glauca TaxID=4829 RepID=A0A168RNZ7_ABSGL|nr:hypothetical protein [Absidia glauca]